MITSFERLQDRVTDVVSDYVYSMKETNAQELGLDPRAGYCLFINKEAIVVTLTRAGSLDYYGGFEYISSDHVSVLGEYKFYRLFDNYGTKCDRVWECICKYYGMQYEEEGMECE